MIIIEQKESYGHGRVELTGGSANGILILRQDSKDHDYHESVEIDSLDALLKVEALVAETIRQLEARNHERHSREALCEARV